MTPEPPAIPPTANRAAGTRPAGTRPAGTRPNGDTGPRSRASREVLDGRSRAARVAVRLGTALRDARKRSGRTQRQCSEIARISQPRWSGLERGQGVGAPLETWAIAAAAVGQELAAFLDQASGADLPRDIQHLRRQSALVERAAKGGWAVAPEMPVVAGASGRVIDALLTRAAAREAAVFEVWDLLLDVGAAFRSFDEKLTAVRAELPGWTVCGAWILRGTRRNRSLVAELAPLFRARFPGAGGDWLGALDSPSAAMPKQPALLWTDATDVRLGEARIRSRDRGGRPTSTTSPNAAPGPPAAPSTTSPPAGPSLPAGPGLPAGPSLPAAPGPDRRVSCR
jgi:transcriptional regulator with XRE-family HTH domain